MDINALGRSIDLRMFEPDLVALASMNEVEATEKFLMETLARVEERKVSARSARRPLISFPSSYAIARRLQTLARWSQLNARDRIH